MPEEQEIFRKAVGEILEAVMFENWLRFYFIKEEPNPQKPDEPELKIGVPPRSMERIKALYPQLFPMAERMNGGTVDFETSRRVVLTHVLDSLDGKTMPKDMAQIALASSTFQNQLQLFNAWEQLHEDQLEKRFLDFGAWAELFKKWLDSKGARELAATFAREGCGEKPGAD